MFFLLTLSISRKKNQSSSVLEEFPDVRHVATWDVSVGTGYGASWERNSKFSFTWRSSQQTQTSWEAASH